MAIIEYAESLGHGEFHVKLDVTTGLRAIVAIHNTQLGPALGGCRCIEYHNFDEAVRDALRLSQGMSYKAAMASIPHGGGKSVLMKPAHIPDRESYFKAFGRFVEDLGGRYITAMDSGTEVQDMDWIATQTRYITTNSLPNGEISDPSGFTAKGTLRGIEAAVKYKLDQDTLEGIHVAIQGVGHVGYLLAKMLYEAGAQLTVADVEPMATQRCADEFGATIVSSDIIHMVACDVYAPCALGAIINDHTLPLLSTFIVAGAANNQLAEPRHGRILQERGILYAPDYVINAGGLIHAVEQYEHAMDKEVRINVDDKIDGIYDTLMEVFLRAEHDRMAASDVADKIAISRLLGRSVPVEA